jgi:carbamate kinase
MHDPDLIERNVRTKALAARDENELDLTDARAHKLVMVTSVDRVALDDDRPSQQWPDRITMDQARRYLAAGQFPPGSMGPKIEAAIDFLEH